MRQNYNLVIPGNKAILVPYRSEHVHAYHSWMVGFGTLKLGEMKGIRIVSSIDRLLGYIVILSPLQQDTDLQESTASDPLTLDEEYQMQQSWRDDNDSKPA